MSEARDRAQWVEDYNQREVQFVGRVIVGLNGTGVIALLAFLGQIWENMPHARRIIIISIAGMIMGLMAITLSTLLRLRSMDRGNRRRPKSRLDRVFARHQVYIGLRVLSFLLFVASVLYLLANLFFLA